MNLVSRGYYNFAQILPRFTVRTSLRWLPKIRTSLQIWIEYHVEFFLASDYDSIQLENIIHTQEKKGGTFQKFYIYIYIYIYIYHLYI